MGHLPSGRDRLIDNRDWVRQIGLVIVYEERETANELKKRGSIMQKFEIRKYQFLVDGNLVCRRDLTNAKQVSELVELHRLRGMGRLQVLTRIDEIGGNSSIRSRNPHRKRLSELRAIPHSPMCLWPTRRVS